MKLSKRERVLILILIITIAVYAAFKFGPSLNFLSLDALREEYINKSAAYNEMTQNIVLKSKHEENLNTIAGEINDLRVISDLRQEQLIVFLNSSLAANSIDASGISFTDMAPVSITPAAAAKTTELSSLDILMNEINANNSLNTSSDMSGKPEEGTVQQSEMTAQRISATVAFRSTYENMLKFIDAIQNNNVDISITNINTIVSEREQLQGTMILNFYEIPKPDNFTETNGEWIWSDISKSGKLNPFSLGSSVFAGNAADSYDFSMSVMPDSSDIPAVILGKTNDDSRETYLYADGNAVVNVNFEFKEESGRYYYKYNVGNGNYPENGSWKELSPLSSGNVFINVYSSKRNSNADSVGVNVGVVNTSNLKIRFDVSGDDQKNSRVYFKDPKSVVVTRK